jgi:NADPH:quinone reductase
VSLVTETMRAVVLERPGPPSSLQVRRLPVPRPEPGWVRIRVEAFGLNRSELHTRLGLAVGVTFPRVLGIECAGVVDLAPGTALLPGQQVVAMMGGMGRTFDGGYAEYTVVPARQVIPIDTDLPWEIVGAVPEMLQTAHGSLTIGLDLQAGQTLLVRGGTSSVGLTAAALARSVGATVLSTTRQPDRLADLAGHGVDHPLLDRGRVAPAVREIVPGGVDAALELVGTPTLPDTLAATRVHGTVCFAGILSDQWTVPDFYPIGYLPNGVRLTAYGGDSTDLPQPVLQHYLDDLAAGRLQAAIHHVYTLDEIQQAHADMENNRATGKLVVRVHHDTTQ